MIMFYLEHDEMINDIDILRSAKLLIDQQGDFAGLEAAGRADAFLANGDMEGHLVWIKIGKRIEELSNTDHRGKVH